MDGKGRLGIPMRYRATLDEASQGKLVVTADPSRCLLVYPLPHWSPIQQRLMGLSSFNETLRGYQRLLVGHADDVDVDATGRILVPPALRDFAALDKHVVLVGQGNHFELWNRERWDEQIRRVIETPAAEMPAELDRFSL
jgi:MraZ protein